MSKITSQAKILKGLQIGDEENRASSAGLVSDKGMHIPDVALIDAKNALPTIAGYTSFFGVDDKLEDTALTANSQEIITYKTLHGDAIQIAFCAEGLWMRALAGDAVATLTNVAASGDDPEYDRLDLLDKKAKWIQILATIPTSPWKLWTYTLMENHLYVYQKGMDFIGKVTSYEPEQVIFEHLIPTYIIGDQKRHTFTFTSEDDSAGDDTYKSITISTDTGLAFGTQRINVDSASDVSLVIESWEAAFASSGLFSTNFTETIRTEVDIDAFIPIENTASIAKIQAIIDATAFDGIESELKLEAIWESQ